MNINNIQQHNFYGKNMLMPESAKNNLQKLLYRMNHDTKYNENSAGTTFTSNILSSVNIQYDKAVFSDCRYLYRPTDKIIRCKSPDCAIQMGKNIVHMNSSTGEVFPINKSLFKSWKKVLNDAYNYIKIAIENYDNIDIIAKNSFSIRGFTKKGLENFENTRYKIR